MYIYIIILYILYIYFIYYYIIYLYIYINININANININIYFMNCKSRKVQNGVCRLRVSLFRLSCPNLQQPRRGCLNLRSLLVPVWLWPSFSVHIHVGQWRIWVSFGQIAWSCDPRNLFVPVHPLPQLFGQSWPFIIVAWCSSSGLDSGPEFKQFPKKLPKLVPDQFRLWIPNYINYAPQKIQKCLPEALQWHCPWKLPRIFFPCSFLFPLADFVRFCRKNIQKP